MYTATVMDISLSPGLKIGCCGFAAAQKEYVRLFKVVEIQQTFYQPPQLATLERWRALASATAFEFTLKAWQLITHEANTTTYRRVRWDLTPQQRAECGSFKNSPLVRRAWEVTGEYAKTLGARLVLFQCPASFKPTPLNIERMHTFFTSIARDGLQLMWEPRGDWPDEIVNQLCQQLDLIHVVDPFVRATLTPDKLRYYRLHGGEGYRHQFDASELADLHQLVLTQPTPAYVMFNNLSMREDALRFSSYSGETRPV